MSMATAIKKQVNTFQPSVGALPPTKPTGTTTAAAPTGNTGGTQMASTAGGNLSSGSSNIIQQHNAGQQGAGQNTWTNPLPGTHTGNNAANAAANAAPQYDLTTAAGAQAYLTALQGQKPGEFASPYAARLSELYNQIVNRDPFSYDLNGDMLYQNYRDQYMQQGRQAMMDTMGQAAALTGGYGSSYASTAGNQAYQQYLTQLNNIVPELYDRAYGRWKDEGSELYNQMNMTQGLDDTAYGRWSDDYNRWLGERDYATNIENNLYNRSQSEQDKAYNRVMQMAQMGQKPSDKDLAAAGLTRSQFNKLTKKKQPKVTARATTPPPKDDTKDDKKDDTGGTTDDPYTYLPLNPNLPFKLTKEQLDKLLNGE